ncbi:MAG: PAS domain S-box protein [Anaerolineae bacterium]|nr:PAS domain S-box protein [Anaerolineae bacterium]
MSRKTNASIYQTEPGTRAKPLEIPCIKLLFIEDSEGEYLYAREMLSEVKDVLLMADWAATYDAGLEAIKRDIHDVYLVNFRLADDTRTGLDLLDEARALGCKAPMIMLTNRDDNETDLAAIRAGAEDYLVKGQIESQTLTRSIRYALERARMVKVLRENEERFRRIVEEISDSVVTVGQDGQFLYLNPAAVRLTGYTVDELFSMTFTDLIAPEWQEQLWSFYQRQFENQVHETLLEFAIIAKSGEEKWVEQTATLVTEGDNVMGFQGIVRDISARKNAEIAEFEQRALAEALRDTAAALNSTLKLDEVLDRILDSVQYAAPHDGANIMLVEAGTAHVLRSLKRGDQGPERDIPSDAFSVETVPHLSQMIESKRPLAIPDTQADPCWGELTDISWARSYAGAPIRLEDEVIGFLDLFSARAGTFGQVHADRLQAFADQAAIAIKNAQLYGQLEERNAELDAFGHTVAHDLRGPLTNLIGYAEMLDVLCEEGIPPQALTCVQTIGSSALKMDQIISSLLLLATLRNAAESIAEVDMEPVARAAAERFREQIDQRGIKIDIMSDLPRALGHGPWLEEVFANLVDNAIKYIGKQNESPHIIIRGFAQDDNMARYEVSDNGLGIKPEDRDRLFEMFSRFHKAEGRGLGLGLSIIKRIIGKLNGTLGVESTLGEGSTFWFTLPAAK